ncbi:MAG: hypothetical protein ACOVNR_02445 [Chitinophagaceae bacterium]
MVVFKKLIMLIGVILFQKSITHAQMVEFYRGNNRSGIDIMWFKKVLNAEKKPTSFLFFSRNRASTQNGMAGTAFGSTNAISYNFKNGVGIVAVAAYTNNALTYKAGMQYAYQQADFTFFGWLVTDLNANGNIDCFGLLRYTPKINKRFKGLFQYEMFPVLQPANGFWNITLRVRAGAKWQQWAVGFMADFNHQGKNQWQVTTNAGLFLRYDF